jgi:hypothetical protein
MCMYYSFLIYAWIRNHPKQTYNDANEVFSIMQYVEAQVCIMNRLFNYLYF